MTAVRETVDLRAEHEASHNVDGECWLCAVGPAWWGEARRKRGYDAPPFERAQRVPVVALERPVRVHGKYSTYTNHGCRCDACKAAGLEYNRRYRNSIAARVKRNQRAYVPGAGRTGPLI